MPIRRTRANPSKRKRATFKKRRVQRSRKNVAPAWKRNTLKAFGDNLINKPSTLNCYNATGGAFNRDTNTLHYHESSLILPIDNTTASYTGGPGGFNTNRRLTSQVDIRGLKYEFTLVNNMGEPYYFHWAIIRCKNYGDLMYNQEFFRDYGESRDVTFSTSLADQTLNRLPINPDRYSILFHKRIWVPRKGSQTEQFNYGLYKDTNFRKVGGYVPIKQHMQYNDDAGETNQNRPIFTVYWFASPQGAGASALNAMTIAHTNVVFYKNRIA